MQRLGARVACLAIAGVEMQNLSWLLDECKPTSWNAMSLKVMMKLINSHNEDCNFLQCINGIQLDSPLLAPLGDEMTQLTIFSLDLLNLFGHFSLSFETPKLEGDVASHWKSLARINNE